MTFLKKLLRLGRTLRYVPLEALKWRVWSRVKRFYYMSPLYGLGALQQEGGTAEPAWIGVELVGGHADAGQALAQGYFEFVGHKVHLGVPPKSWMPAQASALWIFNLHYHEWLADLRAAGQREAARALVGSWLTTFGSYHATVWHPYPTSLRLVSWLTHGAWLLDGAEEDFRYAFYDSLYRQAVYLAENPERDLGGNHLLKNLKAMIYAGLALDKPEIYSRGMAGLLHELPVQILPDGMHDERTPMYAAQVLRDLLDIRAVLRKTGGAPKVLDDAVRHLGTALGLFVHGDGRLGLFNDSAELEEGYIAQLLRLSGAGDAPDVLPDAGYARLERGSTVVLFDAGKVGPDANPGHAHADTLSLEMSMGRERVVVNGGTYAYQHALRNLFRGTAAHSTVSLEGMDSAEVWGGFRVGRRPEVVELRLQDGTEPLPGGDIWVEGRHDGYGHVGCLHRRKLLLAGDGSRLRGEDELVFQKPLKARVRAHFHLHPDILVKLLSDDKAELETASGLRLTLTVTGGRLDVKESRYAPQFGKVLGTRQLIIHGKVNHGLCRMDWVFQRV